MSTSRPVTVVLAGMMGAGKSSVGRQLADRTGWPYLDNDSLVRSVTGQEPAVIDSFEGEAALHQAESTALQHALALPSPRIVGAAAWVIEDPRSVAALEDGPFVVYLRASPETLRARIGHGDGRRADATDLDWLRARVRERDTRYVALADLVVETDDAPASEVAERILEALAKRP